MYSFNSRVRYSETDSSKLLTLTGIINYFQDASTFHSEEAGVGIDFLSSENRAWLLNSWQIVINKFPSLGDPIKITTWPYDFRGTFGSRNFLLEAMDGTPYAFANSLWFYMDTAAGHPARVPKEVAGHYYIEEKYQMDYAPRKVFMPAAGKVLASIPIVPANIDTNHHVNNGQYVQIAEQYLPVDFCIGQMRAEYKQSAVLGDTVVPKVSFQDNLCTVSLNSVEDAVFAIVEFTKKV